MFVTSIDVEEGIKSTKRQRKKSQSAWKEYQGQDGNGQRKKQRKGG